MKSRKSIVCFILIMFAISVSYAETWTESKYGTEYSYESLVIRESILDKMQKYARTSVTRQDLANILDLVLMESIVYNLDAPTMLALIAAETNFKSTMISCLGAKYGRGLMQVSEIALIDYNKNNGTNYLPRDLFDIELNIKIGFWVYNQNAVYGINRYDIVKMLSAYNLGVNNVKNNGKIATEYVDKIVTIANYFYW